LRIPTTKKITGCWKADRDLEEEDHSCEVDISYKVDSVVRAQIPNTSNLNMYLQMITLWLQFLSLEMFWVPPDFILSPKCQNKFLTICDQHSGAGSREVLSGLVHGDWSLCADSTRHGCIQGLSRLWKISRVW
jgi:hypothetical protein